MQWLNNLAFRWKLLIPIALISGVMGLQALYALSVISSMGGKSMTLSHDILPSVDHLVEADRDLYQCLVAERSILFVDPEAPGFADLVEEHRSNIAQALERINKFEKISSSPLEQSMLKDFHDFYNQWVETTREIVNQRSNNGSIGRTVAIDLSFGKGAEQFAKMRDVIDRLSNLTLAASEQTVEALDVIVSSSRINLLTALTIGLGLCFFVAIVFPIAITRAFQRIISRIEDIADGEGDLTSRIEISSSDELGRIASGFNRFIGKLQGIVREISGSTVQLATAAEEMSAVTQETSGALTSQQSEVGQVATAMNEMSATAQEVATNAAHAAKAAQDADQQAKEGTRVISKTISGIRGLASEVQDATTVISKLESDSDSIGMVLDVIRGIAEQTNLLALNAAIEAARAGEQGRGFAVVADEVRTLAQRTQQSTQEIQGMIQRLQEGAQKAVSVMKRSSTQADASVEQAATAEHSLSAITASIVRILDMNMQIASAAEEQTAVSEEINRSMTKVNDLTEQTAGGSQQTASAVTELARLAARLDGLVAQFKVA